MKIPLKYALRPSSAGAVAIKGAVASEPAAGLFPGFSASGQDVWLEESMAKFSGPGLILSAVGARCGKVFLADGRWGVVANTTVLLPSPRADVRFLWYLINDEDFWEKGVTAQPYVRIQESLHRQINLPNLEEQRRIADFLDEQVSLIDRACALRARSLWLAEASFNGGVDGELNSQITYFTPLKRLLAASPSYGVLKPDRYEAPDGVPLVRTLDVTPDGTLRTDQLIKISPGQDDEYARTRLQSGDIALSVVGTIGRSFIADDAHIGFNLSRALARLVPRPGVSSHWIRWWLQSQRFQNFVSVTCQGTAQSVLNMGDLVNFPVGQPGREADHQLRRLDQLERTHVHKKSLMNRQVRLLEERKQALITAAVAGQFDVTTARGVV